MYFILQFRLSIEFSKVKYFIITNKSDDHIIIYEFSRFSLIKSLQRLLLTGNSRNLLLFSYV